MSNLDDKILGEKTHYYCSSSENEDDDDGDQNHSSSKNREICVQSKIKWEGTSCNTGPKGVIEDFQRYKKFETERLENSDKVRIDRIKKSNLTTSSTSKPTSKVSDDLDDENDPFMNEYIAKRMKEMLDRYQQAINGQRQHFGELKSLNSGEDFLKIIDDPKMKTVIIITHIYNHRMAECNLMNKCLGKLAKKYQQVLFCTMDAAAVGMSREFTKYGVPALLVYKNGELIGNFVSLGDEFGTEFDEKDIEDFLVENNILISSQLISSISVNSNLSKIQRQQKKD